MPERQKVTQIGDWHCDLRVEGAYKGQRVATKFRPGTYEVEMEAEWCMVNELGEPFPEEEQALLVSSSRVTGTVLVPVGVLEWLRTGRRPPEALSVQEEAQGRRGSEGLDHVTVTV